MAKKQKLRRIWKLLTECNQIFYNSTSQFVESPQQDTPYNVVLAVTQFHDLATCYNLRLFRERVYLDLIILMSNVTRRAMLKKSS